MRVLAVVNHKAGDDRDAGSQALAMLRARGVYVDEADAPNAAYVDEAILRAPNIDAVVLGGGDGTFSLALPALLKRGLPLGVLPLGTANDFARSIGIDDLEAACDAIAAQHVRAVDVGTAEGVPFLNAAAIGVPAVAARELTPRLKKTFGMLATAAAAPSIARRAQPFWMDLHIDGTALRRPHTVAALVTVGRFVGGFPVEYSGLDDGVLHVIACRARRFSDAVSLAFSALFGRMHRDANVAERSGRCIEIHTANAMDVAIDGDVRAKTPVTFGVLARALRVFVPIARCPEAKEEASSRR